MQKHYWLPRTHLHSTQTQPGEREYVNDWGQGVTAEDTRFGFNVAWIHWHSAHLLLT
jgi:hypothetical protein